MLVHVAGAALGAILLGLGTVRAQWGYIVPGAVWLAVNVAFMTIGPLIHRVAAEDSMLFSTLFMVVPALLMAPCVFATTYGHHDLPVKALALLVGAVDLLHCWQMHRPLFWAVAGGGTLALWAARWAREVHYDDVGVDDAVDEDGILADGVGAIFVIPKFRGVPLADRPAAVAAVHRLRAAGVRVGMHGVTHEPASIMRRSEFGVPLTRAYVADGVAQFTRALGFAPTTFKAPAYNLLPANAAIVRELGMTVEPVSTMLFNRVLHPVDDHTSASMRVLNAIARRV
jgi:hypothetical protein